MRVGEEDAHAGLHGEALVAGHFLALVVGQGLAQRGGDGVQRPGEGTGGDIGFAGRHLHQHD